MGISTTLSKLRIRYWPYSRDLTGPSDRRRLLYWANKKKVPLTFHPTENFEILYATVNTPLREIIRAKEANRLVFFELVDSYSTRDNLPRDVVRAIYKGDLANLKAEFRFSEITRMKCSIADKIVVPNIEIATSLGAYSQKAYIVLDSHEEIEFVDALKREKDKRLVLWEGQKYSLPGLLSVSAELEEVFNRNPDLNLAILTDPLLSPWTNGKFVQSFKVNRLAKKLVGKIELHDWNIELLKLKAQQSRIAIIPINLDRYLAKEKPENRLLIMWRLGLPTLVSPLRSYQRVMNQAGVKGIVSDQATWADAMRSFLENPEAGMSQVRMGQEYIRNFHNENSILKAWDEVMDF